MSVNFERQGNVAVIALDWPERKNALNPADLQEVATYVQRAADQGFAVIVLTGNGAFCSGGHLGGISERTVLSAADHRRQIADSAQRLVRTIVGVPMPVIAAIDGPAIGLGFDLALACDYRLIGPDGWCMQGWGRVGLIPGDGGILLLQLLNPSLLWRLLATQPRMTGPELERLGLGEAVNECTAIEAALERAASLSALPQDVLELYVSLQRAVLRRELPNHLDICAREQGRLLADPALVARIESLQHAIRPQAERP
jgi:2-(1,2-epoxy-1,2-dihydrophenyl)acetyl-CoA isomerase